MFVTSKLDAKLLEHIEKDHICIMEKTTKASNYRIAIKRLCEAVDTCLENEDTLLFDGLIQHFEFSTELAWKTCSEKLLALGCVDVNGPKPVMREAFAHGLIDDEKAWIIINNDRNLTSHIYSDDAAKQICERIIHKYLTQFEKLAQLLTC